MIDITTKQSKNKKLSFKDILKKLVPRKEVDFIRIAIALLTISLVLILVFATNKKISYAIKNTVTSVDHDTSYKTLVTLSPTSVDNEACFEIKEEGDYYFTGTQDEAVIYINAENKTVHLFLDNVLFSNSSHSIIVCENAEKVYVTCMEGTTNSLVCKNGEASYRGLSVDGCIYSKEDITLNGSGELKLISQGSGIKSSDGINICDVELRIDSMDHAVNANDFIQIDNANITINSGNDSLHVSKSTNSYLTFISGKIETTSFGNSLYSSGNIGIIDGDIVLNSAIYYAFDPNGNHTYANEERVGTGNSLKEDDPSAITIKAEKDVVLKGGNIEIETTDIGVKAENNLFVDGAMVAVNTTDKALKSANNTYVLEGSLTLNSSCGIKSGKGIYISGGIVDVDSSSYSGDGINADDKVEISGGKLSIESGTSASSSHSPAGIHCDNSILISGGEIEIKSSYEGLEAINVTISGGKTNIQSSDDAININCQPNESMGGFGGSSSSSNKPASGVLKITGGFIYAYARGDGLDSNDEMIMTGGIVVVIQNSNANGALDYDTTCKVTGGTLIACGSSSMAQGPTSGQCSLLYNFSQSTSRFLITDSSGNFIAAFANQDITFTSICVSTSKLRLSKSYNVYLGSSFALEGESYNDSGYYQTASISNLGNASTSYQQTQRNYSIGSSSIFGGGGMGPGGGGMGGFGGR